MTIARRLLILVAVPLLILLSLGVLARLHLAEIEKRTQFAAVTQVKSLAALGNISRSLTEMRVNVRNHLLASDETARAQAKEAFEKNRADLTALLQMYDDTLIVDDRDGRLTTEYKRLSDQWVAGATEVMLLTTSGRVDEANTLLAGRVNETGNRLSAVSIEWIQHNERLANDAGVAAFVAIHETQWNVLVAIALALCLSGWLGFRTFRSIVTPIRQLQASVESIASGNYAKQVPCTEAVDETGALARAVDVLKQGASAMSEQRWVKSNASQITGGLQGAASLAEFSQKLVSELVPVLGGGVAGFYLFEENPEGLRRIAAYGLSKSGTSQTSFSVGEGLVGQCAQDRKTVTLDHLPPEYLQIASGVGAAPPVQAVAFPLLSGSALLGVLEIASFRPFHSQEKALLEEVLPVVAMSLEILQRNLRTQELLTQTQEQARTLEEQTEELTQSQEELLAQKEELLAQQQELTTQREDLKLSEERTRLILESSAEGIFGVDTQGRIGFVNPAACRMLGFTAEEMIGQPSHDLIHHRRPDGSIYPNEECPMFDAYRHGKASRIDNELLWRKDGIGLPVEYGATPIVKEGSIVGAVISFTDITIRKNAEAEVLAAKEKAEEATQMKSMFLANMSHEIRTPMNAIIGLSHLALKTPLNAKQRDYISKVHNAGTSLLSIINDILDFSKIEAGKLDIETTDFQLDEVIGSVTTITAQKAHEKGLEFLADIASAVPEQLRGDPLRLGQILTNLVNNAVKFTERGEIRLKIEVLERTGEKVQLKFSVRDTGIGMTKEQAARLFQPFSQADMSTTRKHGGTGLGLTICRRLVELMGGQIWLESEPGVGSCFLFTLWLGIGLPGDSARIVPRQFHNLRVLVVDDNAAAREILSESIGTLAQHVDTVSSGHEALAAIRERDADTPYDVVFMDWRMPGMDGLQATRLIKNDASLRKQPAIVIVTAFGREEVREEAEALQVDAFLVKPVTKSMLVDSLVNVFAAGSPDAMDHSSGTAEESARLRGLRALLTEDNEINQQIAVELLESVGATVDVASNGRIAVEMLAAANRPYDVVLMDLQMPEMDGYQATTRIRSDALHAGLPIIAMTAHATMEERQRCLDAGMNDHVSKPIDPNHLFETLARYYRPASAAIPAPAATTPAPVSVAETIPVVEGLDTQDGLSRVGGNRRLYLKLLRQFVAQQGLAPAQIVEALSHDDRPLAERVAHTAKGVAGSLGARDVQEIAAKVEKSIAARTPLSELGPDLKAFKVTLGDFIARLGAALPGEQASSPTPSQVPSLDPVQTRKVVEEMMAHLGSFDPAAADCLESHRDVFRALMSGDAFAQFEQHISGFAFADALAGLQQAAAEKGFLST